MTVPQIFPNVLVQHRGRHAKQWSDLTIPAKRRSTLLSMFVGGAAKKVKRGMHGKAPSLCCMPTVTASTTHVHGTETLM
jgi:hypothetical protein